MSLIKKLQILLITIVLLISFNSLIFAQTPTPNSSAANELQKKINELQDKINDLQGQERTLSSQIAVMDNQIKLTEYQIQSTEQQITDITLDIDTASKKIDKLQVSLNSSISVLLNRIVATYEVGTIQPLQILLTSTDATNFFSRLNYLRRAQAHDKQLVYQTQQAKTDYSNQKTIFEDKKKQIEGLKTQLLAYESQLDGEKQAKQNLLAQTKGSEATYQALLAETKAEFEAIQGIVSGNGAEGEIGQVNQGDTIAVVKQGASCNSSGTHLHFTVSRNGSTENPFNYLKPVDHNDQSGGDPWNPSGSWEWPISPPIQYNQGYGNTSFSSSGASFYSFHNGIDISGSSSSVKAVKSGTLFQGSYTGNAGCRLQYVRVHHQDDGLDTFYLHVNYVH